MAATNTTNDPPTSRSAPRIDLPMQALQDESIGPATAPCTRQCPAANLPRWPYWDLDRQQQPGACPRRAIFNDMLMACRISWLTQVRTAEVLRQGAATSRSQPWSGAATQHQAQASKLTNYTSRTPDKCVWQSKISHCFI